jgi:hypothetical protein
MNRKQLPLADHIGTTLPSSGSRMAAEIVLEEDKLNQISNILS